MSERQFFPPLTGFRAVAALMVYFSHYNPFLSEDHPNNFLSRFTYELQCGVGLFFVLSGFLITYKYFDISKHFRWKLFRQYMVNRMARIYPVFFLITAATFIFHGFDSDHNIRVFLLNITFLKGFTHCFIFSGIMPGWSLTVEEVFYFLAPFIFLFLAGIDFRGRLARMFIVLASCMAICFISWKCYGFLNDKTCWFLDRDQVMAYTFFGRCFDFLCGMFLALQFREKKIPTNNSFALRTYGGIGLVLSSVIAVAMLRDNLDWSTGIRSVPGLLINNFYLPLGTTILIAGLLSEKSFVSKILGTPLMLALGKGSYSFYLIHVGIIHYSLRQIIPSEYFCLPAMLLISYGIYHWIEHPLHRRWSVKLTLP